LIVRIENPRDVSTIRAINEDAFGRPDEADLIERLRAEDVVLASLVAELDGRAVGHILFSRMWIDTISGAVPAVALAPMAVRTEYQRQGVGQRLVRHGLNLMRSLGEQIVIVLGHPDYYARFGFSVEKARGLESPFPPEAFMAIEFNPGALTGVHGKVRYPTAFGL
jgi:putative acetyltransferase